MKTCCVIGASDIPAAKLESVRRELRREVARAIDAGFTRFISGFESAVDFEFAAIVAEIKQQNKTIFLEAALLYPGQMKSNDERFRKLLKQVNGVMCVSEAPGPDSPSARNRYLVEQSLLVIAVFDGDTNTDAGQTIRISAAELCDLRVIGV